MNKDMTKEEMEIFDKGYNAGFFEAIQVMAGKSLKILNTVTLLKTDKIILSARIQLAAKYILQRRGLMPSDYDVLRGKANRVELNFDKIE